MCRRIQRVSGRTMTQTDAEVTTFFGRHRLGGARGHGQWQRAGET